MTSVGADHSWTLTDTGTTTFTGTAPLIGTHPACGYVDIAWTFSNPAASIASTQLYGFADGTPHPIPSPAPGTTQTMVITLAHDASYTGGPAGYLPGLIIYAPVRFSVAVGSTAWHSLFSWSDVRTPTTGPATFLM
jgi:hypothetical protein